MTLWRKGLRRRVGCIVVPSRVDIYFFFILFWLRKNSWTTYIYFIPLIPLSYVCGSLTLFWILFVSMLLLILLISSIRIRTISRTVDIISKNRIRLQVSYYWGYWQRFEGTVASYCTCDVIPVKGTPVSASKSLSCMGRATWSASMNLIEVSGRGGGGLLQFVPSCHMGGGGQVWEYVLCRQYIGL